MDRATEHAPNIRRVETEPDNPELDIAPARVMSMQTINFDPRRKCQSRDAKDAHELRYLLLAMLEA